MYLREIPVGSKVLVHVHNQLDVLEYTLDIVDYKKEDDILIFNGLYQDEKLLNFGITKKINHCDILYLKDSTYVFKDVNIYNISKEDSNVPYHCAIGSLQSDMNNRDSPRHIVNMLCEYKRGNHRGITQARLKDISLTGFAILVDGRVNMFDEPTIDLDFPQNYPMSGHIRFSGDIVRIVGDPEDVNSIKLVGFRVHENSTFRKWVMTLERERTKNLRGKL